MVLLVVQLGGDMIKRQACITGGCASNFVSYLLLLLVLPIRSILTLFSMLSMLSMLPGTFHRDGGHHEEASLEPCGGGGNEVRTIIATP